VAYTHKMCVPYARVESGNVVEYVEGWSFSGD